MSIRPTSLSVLSLALLAALACSAADDDGMNIESGLTGGSFMYLRCNSTSWNVDAKSRMTEIGDTKVVELTLDVKHSWMLTTGDDCVLTETPSKDSWGNWQRYYTAASAPVMAPATVGIVKTDYSPKNFRVRFPELGRFRVLVDTEAKTLMVAKAGELEPGQITWTTAGEIARDARQNLYRLDPTRTRLELLDRATGSASWSYSSSTGESLTFVPACALNNTVVALEGKHVIALDATTGVLRWDSSLEGVLDSPTGSVHAPVCREDLGQVFVSYIGGPDGVAALGLADGRRHWGVAGSGSPLIRAVTAGALVYSEQDPTASSYTVRAVSPSSGQALWSYVTLEAADAPFADAADNLLRLSQAQLMRLDATTGSSLWTRPATSIIASTERGAIYAVAPRALVEKIRATDGATLWSHSPNGGQTSAATRVLGSHVVLSQASGAETTFTVLDSSTGGARWTRSVPFSYAYIEADPLGRLFIVNAEKLENVDTNTGAPLWTYTAPLVQGYGPSHIQSVLDGDARGVYIMFADWGPSTAPAGLAALEPATGAARWASFDTVSLFYVGSDLLRLFMQVSGQGGPVEGRAYAK